MQITVELTEADLLARMRNYEDQFVERKTVGDHKDWQKTAVAFANSAPVGSPAVLYIGVKDDGQIEDPQRDLDQAQKKFNEKMQAVYPRIASFPKIINDGGRQALAIIVYGSELRPHFAGLSYIRKGSQTFEASEEQFAELIAQRSSKAAWLLKWKGKNITASIRSCDTVSRWPSSTILVDCNQFYVTLQRVPHEASSSFSLNSVEINYDNLRNRLQLEITDHFNSDEWDAALELHVRQISGMMTFDGHLLLRELLLKERVESLRPILPQISREVQTAQLSIAMQNGIIRSEQDSTGLRKAYFVVSEQYRRPLRKFLAETLR